MLMLHLGRFQLGITATANVSLLQQELQLLLPGFCLLELRCCLQQLSFNCLSFGLEQFMQSAC